MNRPGAFQFANALSAKSSRSDSASSSLSSVSSESFDEEPSSREQSSVSSLTESVDSDNGINDFQRDTYTSRDGTVEWSAHPPRRRGRRGRQNVVHEVEGPAPHVRSTSLVESFFYFFTADMLQLIVDCTNMEAERKINGGAIDQQVSDRWFPLCESELRAFLGILLLQGVLKGGRQRRRDFWDNRFGQPSIIATMSENRFYHILKFLRFDNRTTRPQRQQEDRLAPIRQLWEYFCVMPDAL